MARRFLTRICQRPARESFLDFLTPEIHTQSFLNDPYGSRTTRTLAYQPISRLRADRLTPVRPGRMSLLKGRLRPVRTTEGDLACLLFVADLTVTTNFRSGRLTTLMRDTPKLAFKTKWGQRGVLAIPPYAPILHDKRNRPHKSVRPVRHHMRGVSNRTIVRLTPAAIPEAAISIS